MGVELGNRDARVKASPTLYSGHNVVFDIQRSHAKQTLMD